MEIYDNTGEKNITRRKLAPKFIQIKTRKRGLK